jgi:membrane fusion protein, multidrug efflux system
MTNSREVEIVARWALALSVASIGLSGCTSEARTQAAPPATQVSVIEVQPAPVTVYDEYVAQTQAPDTIEIRSQVTGLLARQAFADGARVKKGELLYLIDPRPFEAQAAQARAGLAQAEANLVNAKQALARSGRLIAENAVSRQDYDTAVTQEKASTALVGAQKALLRNAELNLEFATLRASREGFMSSSQVKPGALITAQQTLLNTLYSSDPMWVNFTISEDRLLQVQKALARADRSTPFRIRLGDGTDYKLAGRLDFVDSAIDQKSGTLQVRVSVPNPDRLLRPGQFVRVIVAAFDSPNAIRVPQQAVQELQGTKSVYVVGAGDKAEARQIVASQRIGTDWVVASGLAAGDRVVVEGTGKLRPGVPVKPVAAPAKTAAEPAAASPKT